MSKLFSPLTIKGIELKNRIIVSPMCQYSAVDGFANDWHFVHLASRAVGGPAMIIVEATAVSAEGRISPDDLGIWKDDHIPALYRITTFLTGQQCIPAIQLSHAGRKASTVSPWKGSGIIAEEDGGWASFAPSPIPYLTGDPAPIELSIPDISQIIKDFTSAAIRSLRAGFKAIELHAAHGYLLHQFLSPLTNQRTDHYGGNFENRIRLLLEVTSAIQSVWPADLPLIVRLSATDWAAGGWTLQESVQLAKILKSAGIDLLDVSTGGLVNHQQIPLGPAYQVPFASEIKKQSGILTSAVGLITQAVQAESILVNEDADLIMMAREILRNPYFPLYAAQQLKVDVAWPAPYERAKLY